MSNQHAVYIAQCRKLIEQKLQWGPSDDWKQRDFEQLSDLVFDETGIRLSLSTLKRIWTGSFANAPQPATLNALAVFVGYRNWNHFRSTVGFSNGKPLENPGLFRPRKLSKIAILIMFVLLIAVAIILGIQTRGGNGFPFLISKSMPNVPFTHKILADGVPNTVVFSFDISAIKEKQFFFQQTWNDKTRVAIPSNSKNYTSIYYYPGYHTAKLFAGPNRIAEDWVHIKTKGWEGLVYSGSTLSIPNYLKDLKGDGLLYFPVDEIEKQASGITKNEYYIRFYNIAEFDSLSGDDFMFTARVRNDVEHGGLTCQDVRFYIFGEHKMMIVPFSMPGCVGNLDLSVADTYLSGQNNDLSALGINLSEWQNIRMESKQNTLKIFTNKTFFKATYKKPLGKLKGIMIEFKGTGAMDWFKLSNTNGSKLYEWEF